MSRGTIYKKNIFQFDNFLWPKMSIFSKKSHFLPLNGRKVCKPLAQSYPAQGQCNPLKSMRLYNVKVISTDVFGTKRATGDPLVSKRPKFLGLYRFTKKLDFLGFWISGFLDFFPFFWISVHIFGNKRATGGLLVSK